jgi:hypothetical protein
VVDALHPPHPIEDLREFVDQAGTNQVGVNHEAAALDSVSKLSSKASASRLSGLG